MRLITLFLCLFFFPVLSLGQQGAEGPGKQRAVEEGVKEKAAPAEEKAGQVEKKEGEKQPSKQTEEEVEPARPEEKWVKIEGDFAYKNVRIYQGGYSFTTVYSGEMVNNTGRNFSIVKFTMSALDGRGKPVAEESFHITDFSDGQTRTFKGILLDGYSEVKGFKIKFKTGVAK